MALTVLDAKRHSDLRLHKSTDFSFARERTMVPVWGQEIPQAARFFPIVFMPRDGLWIPMALMGIEKGRNRYVSARGEWLADYIPAVLRAHPFYSVETGNNEPVLAIEEEDSAFTRETALMDETLPLFEEDGQPSALTQTALTVLEQIRGQQEHTWAAMEVLESLDLLVPWRPQGQAAATVSAELYAVDEEAIKALNDAQFLRLREPGVLPLAYAHLLSLKHFQTLQKTHSQLWLAASQKGANALFRGDSDLFIFEDS